MISFTPKFVHIIVSLSMNCTHLSIFMVKDQLKFVTKNHFKIIWKISYYYYYINNCIPNYLNKIRQVYLINVL